FANRCVCHLLIYSANGVYPTGAVCRIILHNKHDFIKTIFALDACFQQELFQQTISWRVLPEQGKRLTLDRGFWKCDFHTSAHIKGFSRFLSGCHFVGTACSKGFSRF
ncbi:hypothetical protein, partial [Lactiplantibacillus plantarum]|uniref:hypothetical protein n=1 Tax=Lactiplantibacillus plantarum TaxID=1590 RepID=UPI001C9E9F06